MKFGCALDFYEYAEDVEGSLVIAAVQAAMDAYIEANFKKAEYVEVPVIAGCESWGRAVPGTYVRR
jgi:hypothetical protein